ncbi:MAG: hypothetical protein II684_08735 [Treponema sp.]|nr:hypothetical protein [Treponema sp.]
MSERDSFEVLVSDLSPEERKDMLERMQGYGGYSGEESLTPLPAEDIGVSFDAQLKNESLFLRIWIFIKSLISNRPVEKVFNEHRVNTIFRTIDRRFPDLIDLKRRLLLSTFFNRLSELKKSADFFKPYCSPLDGDLESFYVHLGTLAMPQLAEQMNREVDPYSMPVEQGARPEMRVSLLRRMDEVMESIPAEQKNIMYACAKAADWLVQFTRLPFNRFLSDFSSAGEDRYEAAFKIVAEDLKIFSKVLCNGLPIPEEVFEALFIFRSGKEDANRKKDAAAAEEFIALAHEQLGRMHTFLATVPMRGITCVVRGDSYYQPEALAGSEDWFIKYKSGWKVLFDQKWENWLNDCKKEVVRQSLMRNFNLEHFPMLPNRPWMEAWGGLHFRYELTAGFLCWYFRNQFSTFELTLKQVMTEGDFMKKENRQEFVDSFNAYMQVSMGLNAIQQSLMPNGETGSMIASLDRNHSLQAVQKSEQLLRIMESDFGHLLMVFGETSRKMDLLMEGILGISSDSRYDSLANYNTMQGAANPIFKKQLREAHLSMRYAYNLVKDLEPIDVPDIAK